MKLNNKGFAISAIVYSSIILFSIILLGIISILTIRNSMFSSISKKAIEEIKEETSYKEKPKIHFKSDQDIIINTGINKETIDYGIDYIYDEKDGYLSIYDVIIDKSELNTTIPGDYEVKYTISDSEYNTTIVKKNFHVQRVNKPSLESNMYPVKWNGNSWEVTSNDDYNWYSYVENKENEKYQLNRWANVQIQNTSLNIGDTINEENLNLYVWIPRFTYKIEYEDQSCNWPLEINSCNRKNAVVNIKFSNILDDDKSENYKSHPAFCVDNNNDSDCIDNDDWNQLGFWVMKYEASNTNNNATSKPNITAWRNISIDDAFNKSNEIKTNLNLSLNDSHLIKNTEWSAISYLSKSALKNDEIIVNDSNEYITGKKGIQSTTTKNLYGIYDMSGCSSEFTSSYLSEGTLNNYTNLVNSQNKYKNVFFGNSDNGIENYSANTITTIGQSILETSTSGIGSNSWNDDFSEFPTATDSFIKRGGSYNNLSYAGIFGFRKTNGAPSTSISFRTVLIKNN